MIRRRWADRDRGSFTAELAAGLPALVLLLLAGLAAVGAVTIKAQCVDAAREAALAASRGEPGVPAGVGSAPGRGQRLGHRRGRAGRRDRTRTDPRLRHPTAPTDRHRDGGGRRGAGRTGAPVMTESVLGRRDRGSASLWLLAVGLTLVMAGMAGAAVGAARVAKHQARVAADFGALAGAVRTLDGPARGLRAGRRAGLRQRRSDWSTARWTGSTCNSWSRWR